MCSASAELKVWQLVLAPDSSVLSHTSEPETSGIQGAPFITTLVPWGGRGGGMIREDKRCRGI
jgi:hypothetical protein